MAIAIDNRVAQFGAHLGSGGTGFFQERSWAVMPLPLRRVAHFIV